jgi:NAD(P)-dependent dehydrogenase (short-subunit alcohol dehydrogenase family)
MTLEGKVALITGADGVLGTATALRFAREGAAVVLNDFAATQLDRVAAEIVESEGRQALIALGDVSRPAHVDRILREALDAFGRIDILVNAAAGSDPDAAIRCAALCAERLLPAMRERRAGRVLNLSAPGTTEASHDGLIALTRKLALEVAADAVTVNCVVPGVIATPAGGVPEAQQETMTALVPIGRIGEPREIAAALVFLASDDAAYVTGQVLYVDGGLSVAG